MVRMQRLDMDALAITRTVPGAAVGGQSSGSDCQILFEGEDSNPPVDFVPVTPPREGAAATPVLRLAGPGGALLAREVACIARPEVAKPDPVQQTPAVQGPQPMDVERPVEPEVVHPAAVAEARPAAVALVTPLDVLQRVNVGAAPPQPHFSLMHRQGMPRHPAPAPRPGARGLASQAPPFRLTSLEDVP